MNEGETWRMLLCDEQTTDLANCDETVVDSAPNGCVGEATSCVTALAATTKSESSPDQKPPSCCRAAPSCVVSGFPRTNLVEIQYSNWIYLYCTRFGSEGQNLDQNTAVGVLTKYRRVSTQVLKS
jgi:hypothetical protein